MKFPPEILARHKTIESESEFDSDSDSDGVSEAEMPELNDDESTVGSITDVDEDNDGDVDDIGTCF